MGPFGVAMFAVGIWGTAVSLMQQYKLKREAEDIAERNAEIEEARTVRAIEMAEKARAADKSVARARLAASGVTLGEGTAKGYVSELTRLADEEILWMEREGAWRAEQARALGDQAASQIEAGMWQNFTRAVFGLSAQGFDFAKPKEELGDFNAGADSTGAYNLGTGYRTAPLPPLYMESYL